MTIDKPVEGVSALGVARFAERARRAAGISGKVNVLITSSAKIRKLNRTFRGKDKPTDVLSFPPSPVVARQWAGDIAISGEIAAENAEAMGHSAADEIKVLVLHGVLHLAGYDHERDNGVMARREERLRRELKLESGLIARAAGPRLRKGRRKQWV